MNKTKEFTVDFFGVGAQKAGTTWLADFLAEHPEVCMSEPKEVIYFNARTSFALGYNNPNHNKNLTWYRKHFAHWKPNQIRGEFTTDYLFDLDAPENIYAHNPNAKIIIAARNPIDRAYSHYRMFFDYLKLEKRPLREAIENQPEYWQRGKYYEQTMRYINKFGRDNVHIILFDDIVAKPRQILRELCEFLDIDTTLTEVYEAKNRKKSKAIRFKFISRLMGIFTHTMVSLGLSGLVAKLKDLGVKDFFMNLNSQEYNYEKLSPELREYIYEKVRDDIAKFERLIDRDLSHWK